jgi:hypothetical protein
MVSSNSTLSSATSFVVVDGLNVIRLKGRQSPRLDFLLNVLLDVANRADDFFCIFDANTWYELNEWQGPQWADAYAKLCNDHPDHFIECTGGTPADTLILAESAVRDALIVSNDRYRDYANAYPWVKTDRSRFWRLNPVRDAIHIGDHRITLKSDPSALVQELKLILENRLLATP